MVTRQHAFVSVIDDTVVCARVVCADDACDACNACTAVVFVATHDKLAQSLRLGPSALPHALHALDGDETLARPLRSGAGAALHGAQHDLWPDRGVPVAEPDGAEGPVTEHLDFSVLAIGTFDVSIMTTTPSRSRDGGMKC